MEAQVQSTVLTKEKDKGAKNMQQEIFPKNIPGFKPVIKQICDRLVEKRLLDPNEAFCFISRDDQRDLTKIRKLLLIFANRGQEDFKRFLFILRNIENYPQLSMQVRKLVDNFENFLEASAHDASKTNKNGSSKNKRSSDPDQSDNFRSTKRSKSEFNMHSAGIIPIKRRHRSQKTEQKDSYRKSCPDNFYWEHETHFHEEHQRTEFFLKENVTPNLNKLKDNEVVIGIPPEHDEVLQSLQRSESNESLLDAEKVKSLNDVSRRLKIKKKKTKKFFKTWTGLGVMALGAFAIGGYMLSNATQTDIHLDKIGFGNDTADELKPYEIQDKNSTVFKYRFFK